MLEPVLEAASEADRERLLGGAAAPARAVFTIASGEAVDSDTDYDMLHALYVLTARLAGERPLLIAVDDAHWADLPSLRFITFLTHRIDALPAVVIVGARPRVEWRAVERYDVLTADDSIPIIRPRPLSRAAATELADAVAEGPVDDTFADACYQASGGNPFYLRALLREVGQRGLEPTADQAAEVQRLGPEAVRRSVLARLRRLSPDAGAFAGAAAVLGERAAQRIVADLAGLPAERAVAAGDELRAVGILEPGMGIEFEHPIVRTAVYELHSTGERAAAHAQAASILLAAGAPNDVVAAQLLLAEPAGSTEAVDVLRGAAREASGRGAPDVAAVYLGRALAEGAPGDARAAVVMELGLAETMRRTPTAREHLTEAIELATDPNERLRAGIALWSTDSFDGRRAEGWSKSLARHRPKFIYTLPTYQNPAGVTMSLARRHTLLALAARYGVPIVEDDTYAELHFGGEPPPRLAALDRRGLVIYLSTMSKLFLPGLRMGWMAAPPPVVEAVTLARQNMDIHPNSAMQHILHTFLTRGWLTEHVAALRPIYQSRRDTMLAALERLRPRA